MIALPTEVSASSSSTTEAAHPRHCHRAVLDPPHRQGRTRRLRRIRPLLPVRLYTRVRALPADFNAQFEPHLLLRDTFVLNFGTTAITVNAAVAEWKPDRIAGILANMPNYLAGQRYRGALPEH